MITKLIFVCTDNTCQSPMAETIFKHMDHDLDLEVFSRGLVVLFPEPVNPKTEKVLGTHGMVMGNYVAKQFKAEEVDAQTLVLTMTVAQKRRLATDFFVNDNVYTIGEFAGVHEDIADPYGKGSEEYETCFNELYELMDKVAYRLLYGKPDNNIDGSEK